MTNNINNVNLKSLRLDAEKGLMSESALKVLENLGITNVGDLLEQAGDFDAFSKRLPNGQSIRNEMSDVIMLLKCKYLNEDPKIDFSLNGWRYYEQFGFSVHTVNILSRKIAAADFINLLYSDNGISKLKDIRGFGYLGLREVLYKTSIILSYYKNKHERDKEQNENNDAQYVIPQFDLSCCEIINLLKSGRLSLNRASELEESIKGLLKMVQEYKGINLGYELPKYVEQYGYKR